MDELFNLKAFLSAIFRQGISLKYQKKEKYFFATELKIYDHAFLMAFVAEG